MAEFTKQAYGNPHGLTERELEIAAAFWISSKTGEPPVSSFCSRPPCTSLCHPRPSLPPGKIASPKAPPLPLYLLTLLTAI